MLEPVQVFGSAPTELVVSISLPLNYRLFILSDTVLYIKSL